MARGRNKGNDSGGTAVLEEPTEATEVETFGEDQPDEGSNSCSPAVNEDNTSTTETKAELTDEQIEQAVNGFLEVAGAAVETRDESTGIIADAEIDKVNVAYAGLDGSKAKAQAKKALNERMKDAMNSMDIVLARAYMQLSDKLKATKAPKERKERAPKAPADPTEAFVERYVTLALALEQVDVALPEGVAEDWNTKADELLASIDRGSVEAYRAWLTSEAEDKGDAPEVSNVVAAAVKLSLGKSAKPGKASRKATGTGTPYTGERRDIAKHILEAFGDAESGTFKLISEIRKFKSTEYGEDLPSAGAISARLFPKSGKCTLVGVSPATDEKGNKGAVKD